jgi:helicase
MDACLNPCQQEVVDRGLLTSGFPVVLQMPTGSGKTWLAEQAIRSNLQAGQRAIYVTPLRALANELVDRWSKAFPDHPVGVFTGEFGQRQAYPVPFEKARLLVMTPERLDACTRHWRTHWGWLPEVSLLVIDELHLLAEPGRGPRLEGALSRVRRLNPFLQTIGLSATLGNRAELADWLGGVHYGSNWKPIPITWRSVHFKRATDKPGILLAEVARCLSAGGQSLIFVQSRRRAESLSAQLRDAGLPSGHHHAGLEGAERRRLEQEYRSGQLKALVSTGTLEMGLNLPVRQVVLYDLQAFDGTDFAPLSVNSVWQRAGRAGRRGLDTAGEVVLMGAAWERSLKQYESGRFEPIVSRLGEPRALAEQMLAEVVSGLARTRGQLYRNLQQSLAAHQGKLQRYQHTLGDMLGSGMLRETQDDAGKGPALKATRLGRIAVRQMLTPATVLHLTKWLTSDVIENLTLFDTLVLATLTDDCEPLLPVDFEELECLAERVAGERSTLLSGSHTDVVSRLGYGGRRALAALKTAVVARNWTRTGNADRTAEDLGCYPFEVRRLNESLERILTAAVSVATPPQEESSEAKDASAVAGHDAAPTLQQRLRALVAMVTHGVDEQVVTLTFIDGIGGKTARRLRDAGIFDIEDLAAADADALRSLPGLSASRAQRWIEIAEELVKTHSAFSLRDGGGKTAVVKQTWASAIDPYRLRRALELNVRKRDRVFHVSGGLEPHRVTGHPEGLSCDCADIEKGRICKHILAVRLRNREPEVTQLAAYLRSDSAEGTLDLFKLWFEGGRQ